jgi:outer membrane protein
MAKRAAIAAAVLLVVSTTFVVAQDRGNSGAVSGTVPTLAAENPPVPMTLAQCLKAAMEKNRRIDASRSAATAAEAQTKQARSAYWPELTLRSAMTRMDEAPNFVFPQSSITIPAGNMPIPSMTFTIPANAFGPGFPPVDVPLATPPSSISLPEQVYPIPEQNIKLMDRDNLFATAGLVFPLYTGGLRKAMLDQATSGLEAAKEEARRTDLDVEYDVKRAYYGCVLARRLLAIGEDSLARMEAVLDLTERMYKTGTERVKKTDYLRNKEAVETLRSMVAVLAEKDRTARAGLAIAVGLDWDAAIEPSENVVPFVQREIDLPALVQAGHRHNPDLARVKAGLAATEAKVREAKSGDLPKIAFTADVMRIWNDYDAGIVTPENKKMWKVGLGVEVPVFNGFRTRGQVAEARAREAKLRSEERLLQDKVALDVEQLAFRIHRGQEQERAARDAMDAAVENRELNTRAYQDDLVETKDVIEAQLFAAFLSAQYHLVRYDHLEAEFHMQFVVGSDLGWSPDGAAAPPAR